MEDSVEGELDEWLNRERAQIEPRFPPRVEAIYEAETSRQKIGDRKVTTLIGIVTSLPLTPVLWWLVPDTHWVERWIWLIFSAPVGVTCLFILCTRLKLFWQEVQCMVSATTVALAFDIVMLAGGKDLLPVYICGIVLLLLINVVAASLRLRLAACYAAVLTVSFCISVRTIDSLKPGIALETSGLMTAVAVCAVFGAWRVETEQRRNFALMLRQRLRQAILSRRNSELGELTLQDALTGSANRRAYETWKKTAWSSCEENGTPVGLVLVDIDNFKLYNDGFGHHGGDDCLKRIARCMIDQLRDTTDMVARIGGEEFAVILPGATVQEAASVAERVRLAVKSLALPHAAGASSPFVTVSCGAASFAANPLRTAEELFAEADTALYAAKRAGRDRVCLAARDGADAPAPRVISTRTPDQSANATRAA